MQLLIKRSTLFVCFVITGHLTAFSQTAQIERYFSEAGDYAIAYSGEIETLYNPFRFSNTPYYLSPDYVDGELVYRGCRYSNQRLRLDLYKDCLIILTPRSHHGVVVDPKDVGIVRIQDKEIIFHIPPANSGLKAGYYAQLVNGEKLKLLGREIFKLVTPSDRPESYFSQEKKFYVVYQGKYYLVKNRRSLAKIFPSLKKQMKAFAKENMLNFTQDRERSLTQLAKYCEEVMTQQSNL